MLPVVPLRPAGAAVDSRADFGGQDASAPSSGRRGGDGICEIGLKEFELGPELCPFFHPFVWLGFWVPLLKIDYRKSWYPYSNLFTGGFRRARE